LNISPALNIYAAYPISDTEVVPADYQNVGAVPCCNWPISYALFNASGWNDFELNAFGISQITKEGITRFSLRESNYDAPNNEPAYSPNQALHFAGWSADMGLTYSPRLQVIYTP
jgi:hypothetical protein